jgi:hypothetical protein
MLLEIEDVFHVGAAPSVDRLVIVADDADILAIAGEESHKLELSVVRVLILVDDDVAKALLPTLEDIGATLPKADDLANQIVEVERLKALKRRLVAREDLHRDLVVLVDAGAVSLRLAPGFDVDECVLRGRDSRDDRADVEVSTGAQRSQDLAHDAHRVGLIENRELFTAKAERARLGAEDQEAEAMKRRDLKVLGDLRADEVDNAVAHLGRGLVGEGHREDRPRSNALFEEARDALGHDPRLARTRARQNQQRTIPMLDRRLLRRIQPDHFSRASTPIPNAKGACKRLGELSKK